MFRALKLSLTILLVSILTGCVHPTKQALEDFNSNNSAIIITGVAYAVSNKLSIKPHYYIIERTDNGKKKGYSGGSKVYPLQVGYHDTFVVSPGTYVINYASFQKRHIHLKEPLAKFTVKPNEVIYLGALTIKSKNPRNFIQEMFEFTSDAKDFNFGVSSNFYEIVKKDFKTQFPNIKSPVTYKPLKLLH